MQLILIEKIIMIEIVELRIGLRFLLLLSGIIKMKVFLKKFTIFFGKNNVILWRVNYDQFILISYLIRL